MADALAASLVDFLLGLVLAPVDRQRGNRVALEGLTLGPGPDGTLAIGVQKFEATSLSVSSGGVALEIGALAVHQLAAHVRIETGGVRLCALEAAGAELSGVQLHGPVVVPPVAQGAAQAAAEAPASAWNLAPLAAAEGQIRAQIVDAHLLFDADVTVPVRQGLIDFNAVKVAHVGPDSRMGVSRLGIYVDAPNGRSYLYQFASTPVAGVEFERRGALIGPWVANRGSLRLQPFAEGVLRQGPVGPGVGFTEQARLLFSRTAVSGELQLGDGRIAAPGVQADLTGRNTVRLHSEAVGRGITAEVGSLSVRNAVVGTGHAQLACDEVAGAVTLRVAVDGAQMRFALNLGNVKVSGLRLKQSPPAWNPPVQGAAQGQ